MDIREISKSTLRRLPVYLHYLYAIKNEKANISSAAIAAKFGLNDVQVRKDLAMVSGSGRPKTGYDTAELIGQLEGCLGCREDTRAILIGAGNLGKALLSYSEFADYGIRVMAAFDVDAAVIGTSVGGKNIFPLAHLEAYCLQNAATLGVITVPVGAAQGVCDRLVACGVRAIWNFAPTILKAPGNVLVENENLASSLAILSRHIRNGR